MEAGSTFLGALRQAVEEFEGHPLAQEFGRVLADMSLGKTRTEAFAAMRDRLADDEITSIIGSIVQGESLGTPLAGVFRTQADVLRIKRTQRAERIAGEAGVNMLLPGRHGHGRHRADHHRPISAQLPVLWIVAVDGHQARLPPLQDAPARARQPGGWLRELPAAAKAAYGCPRMRPDDATRVETIEILMNGDTGPATAASITSPEGSECGMEHGAFGVYSAGPGVDRAAPAGGATDYGRVGRFDP